MKKKSVFDLVTGVYLLAFGALLINEINFDFSRLSTLEVKPIPSYLLMPVVSELLVMLLFLVLFLIVFQLSNRFQKEVLQEGFSDLVERKFSLEAFFPLIAPGFVIFFLVVVSSFPSYIKTGVYSFYFIAFFLFSSGKMLFAFLEPIMLSSKNEEYKFISNNRPFISHLTFVFLIIAISLIVTIPFRFTTPSPLIFSSVVVGYYFIGGIFFLGLFAFETIKPLVQRSR